MPLDENFVTRVRKCIGKRRGISERKMFGCAAFFLNGNLACGVHGNELIVRIKPDAVEATAHASFRSQWAAYGWLLVKVTDDDTLSRWIDRSITYAATLPTK